MTDATHTLERGNTCTQFTQKITPLKLLKMKTYTIEQWNNDGILSVQIGQAIDNEVYYQLLECVPPTTMRPDLFQVGEPYNHDYFERPVYSTFRREAVGWVFCGHCLKGQTVPRLVYGEVKGRRVIPMEFEGIDGNNRPVFKSVKKWRFGCTDILFNWHATEKEVRSRIEREIERGAMRNKIYYFGNKFGCEPSGEPLYDGDVVVIYWSDGNSVIK